MKWSTRRETWSRRAARSCSGGRAERRGAAGGCTCSRGTQTSPRSSPLLEGLLVWGSLCVQFEITCAVVAAAGRLRPTRAEPARYRHSLTTPFSPPVAKHTGMLFAALAPAAKLGSPGKAALGGRYATPAANNNDQCVVESCQAAAIGLLVYMAACTAIKHAPTLNSFIHWDGSQFAVVSYVPHNHNAIMASR